MVNLLNFRPKGVQYVKPKCSIGETGTDSSNNGYLCIEPNIEAMGTRIDQNTTMESPFYGQNSQPYYDSRTGMPITYDPPVNEANDNLMISQEIVDHEMHNSKITGPDNFNDGNDINGLTNFFASFNLKTLNQTESPTTVAIENLDPLLEYLYPIGDPDNNDDINSISVHNDCLDKSIFSFDQDHSFYSCDPNQTVAIAGILDCNFDQCSLNDDLMEFDSLAGDNNSSISTLSNTNIDLPYTCTNQTNNYNKTDNTIDDISLTESETKIHSCYIN
jgi:hypothetical protein